MEDGRCQDVTAYDSQVGRGLAGLGFLYHVVNPIQTAPENQSGRSVPRLVLDQLTLDDPIAGNSIAWHALDGYYTSTVTFKDLNHLLDARHPTINHIIRKQHSKWLVPHQVAGRQNGVAEAQGLFLADVGHLQQAGNRPDVLAKAFLAPAGQLVLEFEGHIEMVLNRVLTPP